MPSLQYYTSERFIHDDIVKDARGGIPSLYKSWAKLGRIRPFVIAWPAEEVIWHGVPTEWAVAFDAPRDPGRQKVFLKKVQERAAAYAILLWEQRAQAVVGILESGHGTNSWHIPILDHGNVKVLGTPEEKTDVDHLGLSWKNAIPA
jgi:hypothetical protein